MRATELCLEIGVFEGRTTCWLADNIFCGKTIHAVDIFSCPQREAMFDANVATIPEGTTVVKHKGDSRFLLMSGIFTEEMFDWIYVDGSHEGRGVMHDGLAAL